MLKYIMQETGRAREAFAIIINTFQQLEQHALHALSSYLPPIYPIGPLNILDNQIKDKNLKEIGSNLWKEKTECLEWLNSKDPNSMVHVNFGSIAIMAPEQLVEFALGLANTKQDLLWILRPCDSAILSSEFLEETKERCLFVRVWIPTTLVVNDEKLKSLKILDGEFRQLFVLHSNPNMFASSCSQAKVLKHPFVRGFLIHSEWNSTIESISYGLPMICWPFFADQQTNC
ncbi:unnamed protein product [Coffea canephora]|uniref:UDP-glycosyltransferases domain-containing protein n=1 Tax=Coffea canephora TaxID=49390 RepID=A0A068TXU2_COFCA|nr:unnamed protein product [Coffea canephora]